MDELSADLAEIDVLIEEVEGLSGAWLGAMYVAHSLLYGLDSLD